MLLLLVPVLAAAAAENDGAWPAWGNDPGGTRFSPASAIRASNVVHLKPVWTYHTGALEPSTPLNEKAAFEATPILVNGTLYLSTPFDQVIALDPVTGAERWKFDPHVDRSAEFSEVTSRGVSAGRAADGWRIFIGTIDARLIALDAVTGRPCRDFGDNGQVDLTAGVDLRDRGQYQMTSPPAVAGDVVIAGSAIGDNRAAVLERGIVRAFDIRTGALRWTWDPLPQKRRTTGAANAWGVMSTDPSRGLVFIPTGSASPDFYGGQRPGDNKWANSVVALKAATGEFVWGFQVVHHDLWDYDVASQPVLFTFQGKPAVAVTTKMGFVFVLDRLTGKPLIGVEERPVPQNGVPGEALSPTQPFPALPPLSRTKLESGEIKGITGEDSASCRERIGRLRSEGIYTPPTLTGTLAYPGNIGGVNWGSAAIDERHGILVANINNIMFELRLLPRDQVDAHRKTEHNRIAGEYGSQTGTPYAVYREPLLSPHRLPCNAPPWGETVALDLNAGRILWRTPLGQFATGAPPGSPNLGGPLLTGGGLVFTAAAADPHLRAFDVATGKEIWTAELPASAQATPMTYTAGGRQFVVICAGGHGKLRTKQGDSVVAFALEQRE